MALQNTPDLIWPAVPLSGTSASSIPVTSITAKITYIFPAPATDSATSFTFRTNTVTTGCTWSVRLETVGADGQPSGTLVATDTEGTVVIADSDDNVWKTVTFTAPASLTKNTLYAIVMGYSSGGGTVDLNLGAYSTGQGAIVYGIPYCSTYNGSVWTHSTAFNWFSAMLLFGSNYYHMPGFLPFVAASGTGFGTGSNPDCRGMKFQLKFPCKIRGFLASIDGDAPYDVKLYDSDGVTVLSTFSITDADFPPVASARVMFGVFSTPVTLVKDTNYYLSVEPTSASTMNLVEGTYISTSVVGASWFESLTNAVFVTAKRSAGVPGAWTEVQGTVPPFGLILSAIDDGVQVGGGSAVPSVKY